MLRNLSSINITSVNSGTNTIVNSDDRSRLLATSSQAQIRANGEGGLSLNIGLAKKLQHQSLLQVLSSAANLNGNLSPAILVNTDNGSQSSISINNALTIRHPLVGGTSGLGLTSTTVTTSSNNHSIKTNASEQTPFIAQPSAPPLSAAAPVTRDNKKCIYLGDYEFYEAACSTDSFAPAFNVKNGQTYLWKRFDQRDYMKKLEPYLVMDSTCDKIYKFCEIILQSNYSRSNEAGGESNECDQDSVYVLFEPHYGDLHSFMKEKKRLEEPEARQIFSQVVEAVQSCHENGIIIRDIKLKKFVFLDSERTTIGLANLEDCLLLEEDAENDLIKNQQGCPAYVSPEVLNPFQTSYSGKLSDSWSLGIILYTLLVGRYPFHHPTIANMFARIARGKFQVPMPITLSLDARTLLRSLIRVKPEERLRPEEILAHNWFRQNENESRPRNYYHGSGNLRMSMMASFAIKNSKNGSQSQLAAINPLMINKIGLSSSSSNATKNSPLDDSGRDDCCVPQLPE